MLFLPLLFTAVAVAQNSTSTIFDNGVPTNAPVPGDYNGALRPQVHFSPPRDFMNDPNGCFLDSNGTWHLYYQYNPTDIVAGNQHWGHATSVDLYHWTNQKIAIFATEESQIFSGSIVVDTNNTSGFFTNQTNGVVAIYTLNTVEAQVQEIAYSYDNGFTFEKYSGNPILVTEPLSNEFRDPKVIRYRDTWVMVIAYSQDFTVGIFTSPDLISWTHASNFSHHGLLGLQYECPNLVSIPSATGQRDWILVVSINPGAPQGGSISQYFPGSFNGTHFEAVDGAARIMDFGKDSYAGQFFYGEPENDDPVFIAWSSNWQYCSTVPTGEKEGWRSTMGLPRRLHLDNVTRTGWDLIQSPADLTPILDSILANDENLGNGSIFLDYSTLQSKALYIQCNVTNLPNSIVSRGTLNFTISSSTTHESISGGFFLGGDNAFFLSRQNILDFGETNPFFTDKFSVNNPVSADGTFTLEVIIDRSILEVFLDGGRNSGTMTFYPEGELDTFELRTGEMNEDVGVSVRVWGLKSTWTSQESMDGMVYGNLTTGGNETQLVRAR